VRQPTSRFVLGQRAGDALGAKRARSDMAQARVRGQGHHRHKKQGFVGGIGGTFSAMRRFSSSYMSLILPPMPAPDEDASTSFTMEIAPKRKENEKKEKWEHTKSTHQKKFPLQKEPTINCNEALLLFAGSLVVALRAVLENLKKNGQKKTGTYCT